MVRLRLDTAMKLLLATTGVYNFDKDIVMRLSVVVKVVAEKFLEIHNPCKCLLYSKLTA